MSVVVTESNTGLAERATRRRASSAAFVGRLAESTWPATRSSREQVWTQLTSAPYVVGKRNSQYYRESGLTLLLDWLSDQPGQTWQERWSSSGAEAARRSWRQLPEAWLAANGHDASRHPKTMTRALLMAISADIIRPSLSWLITSAAGRGSLVNDLAAGRDGEGFTALRALCHAHPNLNTNASRRTAYRAGLIMAAKGGAVADINAGDVLELLDAEAAAGQRSAGGAALLYSSLHQMGAFGPQAPATLAELRSVGQRSPAQLIDRYQLVCRPVRDLLVDYLCERQPALDYTSLDSLANFLGRIFWADLERHHPGIDSLHLSVEVTAAWKQRLRTRTKTITAADGQRTKVSVDRINYRECLTPVRALYLDLAQWAVQDPARWALWAVPCPIGSEEISRRKDKRRRKSRMDARTRERLPALPVLVSTVDQRRRAAAAMLDAARDAAPGQTFTAGGKAFSRCLAPHASPGKIWVEDPKGGKRRDLALEEERTFWTRAAVEVLRATGIRIEELLELSHHSLVQYRLPTTGELVPLLQIAPSKTDTERLLVISPELADVLSQIIVRVRGHGGAVRLVSAYDSKECLWSSPSPLLFQRRFGVEDRAITAHSIRAMLTTALENTGLRDATDGGILRFTPHDFRRIFITDAILNGLPPHIAQIIAGHRDINVTLGYKAIYPEEAIQAHLAFLARRRALRPSEEYRVPSDAEWQEFLGHFERRKVSIGSCGRGFGTPCIHEHACVRCSMLWPDPDQRPRLIEIRDNLAARIAEAEREGWLGEIEGLHVSLAGANDKLTQIDRREPSRAVDLGIPTTGTSANITDPDPSANRKPDTG